MQHSNWIGGSTAERAIRCPGWKKQAEGMPRKNSADARRGTALHEVIATLLTDDTPPEDFQDAEYQGYTITADDVVDLHWCLEIVQDIVNRHGECELWIEQGVCMGDHLPGCFGSVDLIIKPLDGSGVIYVLDWKFGAGIQVNVEGNRQLLFYALAASLDPRTQALFEGVDEIILVIGQPISRHHEDTPREWRCPIDVLRPYLRTLQMALSDMMADGPPRLERGPHCKFCPAQPTCPEWTGAADSVPLALKPEALDEINKWLALGPQIESWLRILRQYAQDIMEGGEKIPGWKLVEKRGRRQWVDLGFAEQKLCELYSQSDVMEAPKLKSPPQVEKSIGKKAFAELADELVETRSGGTTIAPEEDKRPDMSVSINYAKSVKDYEL